MLKDISTERLILEPMRKEDAAFIRELVNTEGWLKFIGDRNIHSEADALAYIERIINAPNIKYWVVRTKETGQRTGIITLIKRDYLEHSDIGFAFLPAYAGKGYAFEASKAVLDMVRSAPEHSTILATTMPANESSIRLLNRLGLHFDKEIEVAGEILHVFRCG